MSILVIILFGCEESIPQIDSHSYVEVEVTNISFDYDGGDIPINIKSNTDWVIVEGAEWCTPSIVAGHGDATITFTASKNTSDEARSTTFFVEYGNTCINIDVNQSGYFLENITSEMDDSFFIKYCLDNFDLNKDGLISTQEANTVRMINISNISEIRSIKGVEYFANLEQISCENTSITKADLSKNTKLNIFSDNAFKNCSQLCELHIPYSVKSFGKSVFKDCKKLSKIYCETSWPPISDSSPFNNTSSLQNIYVPLTAVGVYTAIEYWSNYNICGYEFTTEIPASAYDVNQWLGDFTAISYDQMYEMERSSDGRLSAGYVFGNTAYAYDFTIEKYQDPNIVVIRGFHGISSPTLGVVEASGNLRVLNGVKLEGNGVYAMWGTIATTSRGLYAISDGTAYNLVMLPDGGHAVQYDPENPEIEKVLPYTVLGYDPATDKKSILLEPGEEQLYFIGDYGFERKSSSSNISTFNILKKSVDAYKVADDWNWYVNDIVGYDYEIDVVE